MRQRFPCLAWCMPGSLTSSFLWNRWRGKRSRHSRCMRKMQFCVFVRRPWATNHINSLYIKQHRCDKYIMNINWQWCHMNITCLNSPSIRLVVLQRTHANNKGKKHQCCTLFWDESIMVAGGFPSWRNSNAESVVMHGLITKCNFHVGDRDVYLRVEQTIQFSCGTLYGNDCSDRYQLVRNMRNPERVCYLVASS